MKAFVYILVLAVVAVSGQKQLGKTCNTDTVWTDINDLVNPNQFYFCENKKTVVGTCAAGRGFMIGTGIGGCVPYSEWPCLKTYGGYPGKQNCNNSPITPWAAADPNQFYICVTNSAGKQVPSNPLNCNGIYGSAGFFRDDTKILGCLDWALWRQYTGCNVA